MPVLDSVAGDQERFGKGTQLEKQGVKTTIMTSGSSRMGRSGWFENRLSLPHCHLCFLLQRPPQ